MQAITYSSGLQQAVHTLKSFDAKEAVRLLKDPSWLKAFALTQEEETAVSKLFAHPGTDRKKIETKEYWT